MWESLKEMFCEQNHTSKQKDMKSLLTTKMGEELSKEYVLKMTSLYIELEILCVFIDKESQKQMVIQTLQDSFQQLHLNYEMNKIDLSHAKLMNELQAAESIIKPAIVLMVDKPLTSSFKPKGVQ